MSVHHRDIVESYLGEESENFALWAWGKHFRTITHDDLIDYWNDLHGDKLELYSTGFFKEDIPKMIEIWRKENDHQSL